GYIANAAFQGCIRLHRRTRTLNPLTLKVFWNRRSLEAPVARVFHSDTSAGYHAVRIEKPYSLAVLVSLCPSAHAGIHHFLDNSVELRQDFQRFKRLTGVDVFVLFLEIVADKQRHMVCL